MPRKTAECVSGILIDEGRVLVEKRRDDDEADPGNVLLPGGHVEPRESLKHALAREMEEELGIRVGNLIPVGIQNHTASDGERQRIHYFHIKDWNGRIALKEAESVYWESQLANLSDSTERKIVLNLLNKTPILRLVSRHKGRRDDGQASGPRGSQSRTLVQSQP